MDNTAPVRDAKTASAGSPEAETRGRAGLTAGKLAALDADRARRELHESVLKKAAPGWSAVPAQDQERIAALRSQVATMAGRRGELLAMLEPAASPDGSSQSIARRLSKEAVLRRELKEITRRLEDLGLIEEGERYRASIEANSEADDLLRRYSFLIDPSNPDSLSAIASRASNRRMEALKAFIRVNPQLGCSKASYAAAQLYEGVFRAGSLSGDDLLCRLRELAMNAEMVEVLAQEMKAQHPEEQDLHDLARVLRERLIPATIQYWAGQKTVDQNEEQRKQQACQAVTTYSERLEALLKGDYQRAHYLELKDHSELSRLPRSLEKRRAELAEILTLPVAELAQLEKQAGGLANIIDCIARLARPGPGDNALGDGFCQQNGLDLADLLLARRRGDDTEARVLSAHLTLNFLRGQVLPDAEAAEAAVEQAGFSREESARFESLWKARYGTSYQESIEEARSMRAALELYGRICGPERDPDLHGEKLLLYLHSLHLDKDGWARIEKAAGEAVLTAYYQAERQGKAWQQGPGDLFEQIGALLTPGQKQDFLQLRGGRGVLFPAWENQGALKRRATQKRDSHPQLPPSKRRT